MKDLYQVLEQKKMEIERVRREIEALHFVIPLLAGPRTEVCFSLAVDDGMMDLRHLANIVQGSLRSLHR